MTGRPLHTSYEDAGRKLDALLGLFARLDRAKLELVDLGHLGFRATVTLFPPEFFVPKKQFPLGPGPYVISVDGIDACAALLELASRLALHEERSDKPVELRGVR